MSDDGRHFNYVFTQVDHRRRQEAIDTADAIDYAQEAQERVAALNLHVQPFPQIPPSLIDLIKVILPGEPDKDGDIIPGVMPVMSREVWSRWRTSATPALSASDISKLQEDGDTLMEYWTYSVAFLSYVRAQLGYWKAHSETLKARNEFLKGQFTLHYMEVADEDGRSLSQEIRRIFVKNDPHLMEVRHELQRTLAAVELLSGQEKNLDEITRLCSRFLTKYMKEMDSLMPPRGGRQPVHSDPHQRIRGLRDSLQNPGDS